MLTKHISVGCYISNREIENHKSRFLAYRIVEIDSQVGIVKLVCVIDNSKSKMRMFKNPKTIYKNDISFIENNYYNLEVEQLEKIKNSLFESLVESLKGIQ